MYIDVQWIYYFFIIFLVNGKYKVFIIIYKNIIIEFRVLKGYVCESLNIKI